MPGTAGFLALTRHDRRLVMVTSHHVLFGSGARDNDPVWRIDEPIMAVGKTGYGRVGRTRFDAADVFVDCAVVLLDDEVTSRVVRAETVATTSVGATVHKTGAASARTDGIVIDTDYCERAIVNGVSHSAPRQILVRSCNGRAFSTDGDSGAAVRNDRGEIVGLLWGVTPRGDGVVCPIAPVLFVLNVSPISVL